MTDISVIKMIISVAVWRIYPSRVNDKLWAWEGLGHSGMFWARLSRDDFRSKLEFISFPSRVMSVSKSFFVSRAFERFGAKCSSSGAFGFDDILGLFLKTPLRHRAFVCALLLRPQVFIENFLSFFQSRAGFTCLTAMAIPSLSKHFGDGTSKTRMKTRLLGVREIERIDRRRDWYKSCAMIRGPEEKKNKKHKEVSVCLCEGSTLHHLQTSEFWGACFRDPTSLSFRTSLFSWTWMYSCRTVRLQRGDSEEKQSSVTFPVLITEA